MDNTMPILLVPGLGGSPRIYAPVAPALWRFGPGAVGNHIPDDHMGAIARRILAEAPPRVALAGHSMGGQIARALANEYHAVLDDLFLGFVHPSRRDDAELRQLVHDMGDDIGANAFVHQQTAIISRADSRPSLAWIKCPTLVLTGDEDNTIPNALSAGMPDGIHGA